MMPGKRQVRAEVEQQNRQDARSTGTLVGVGAWMLLSIGAIAIMALFASLAARQNAAAIAYEAGSGQLEKILRGLNEAALTDSDVASLALVTAALSEFRDLRRDSVGLHADTRDDWPGFEHRIEQLLRRGHSVPFDDDALVELGRITAGLEKIDDRLDVQEEIEKEGARTAERRVQIVNIVVGALMILGTAGFFIVRDTTAKRLLAIVRASESQLRQITDAVPAMIAYVDADRRFRFHNKAYEHALGLTPEQINGHTVREVFGEAVYETKRARIDEVLTGAAVHFEHMQKDVHGDMRDYAVHLFPRHREDREDQPVVGYYSLLMDITDMKRIDRMKTEFVSTVSHELRTPLTSIRGSLGLLTGGVAGTLPDAARSLIEIAKSNCERLIRLINDILDTEKIESGQMQLDLKVVDLRALAAQTLVANEGFAAQHHVTLALHAAGDEMRANVDADRFIQALTNLLSNAIKFSPAQGTVDVSLSSAAGSIRVEVRDRGPGIPQEFLSRIFQKFSQADSSDSRPKSGSGLGLNISKSIIEGLGGTIGFTTEVGVGTRFYFEIPESTAAPLATSTRAVAGQSRPRVLICEDDVDIGHLIGMMLDSAGYDSDLAGTAAIGRGMASATRYAAMTVDLALPDQDGVTLIRALRDAPLTHDLPIVVVSANAEQGRVQLNSQMLSVSDWLGKPIDENRLVFAIRHAIEGSRERPRVLHVEDDPDIQLITAAVAKDFATFEFAATLREARARLLTWKFDLVLLDLNLPEGDGVGWQLVADIDALEHPPPVVVFSAREVSHVESRRVAAVLVKSQTSHAELLETMERVLGPRPLARARIDMAQAA